MMKNIILFILIIGSVFALTGVTQKDTFYNEAGNPVTGVQSKLYTCSSSSCSSQGSAVHNLNSGATNKITFVYPYNPASTATKMDYYSHFLFKQCYLPKEYVESVWGYGVTVAYDYEFHKGDGCNSPIDHFTVTNQNYQNEPVVINVGVDLIAEAHSALTDQQLPWFPAGYEDYYSVETTVTLTIRDEKNKIIHTDSVDLNILMDTSETVEFEWTPTEVGEYTARVTTHITDCQCVNVVDQYSEKEFSVWAKRPQDDCYTLIQGLTGVPEFPFTGDEIEMTYQKISNYQDEYFEKTAVPASVEYEIEHEDGEIVYTDSKKLPANPDADDYYEYGFDWVPERGGHYYITVKGKADSPLCYGIDNPTDSATLDMYVKAPTECEPGVKQSRSCGSDIGQCEVGQEHRTCDSQGNWGSWSTCDGVGPKEEICDGLDNDCDYNVDEGLPDIYSGTDTGECQKEIKSCIDGAYKMVQPKIGPSSEICDGKDNDCDGKTDENLIRPSDNQLGLCEGNKDVCILGDWQGATTNYDPEPESCDELDNDCDGEIDEIFPLGDSCTAGLGECKAYGHKVCDAYGGVTCDAVPGEPEEEVCDGLDNDCDGKVDEDGVCGDCTIGHIEHAKCGPSTEQGICQFGEKERKCVDNGLGGGVWTDYGECKGAVYPEEEVCDGLDNDCDGKIDEDGVCGDCNVGDIEHAKCGPSTDVGICEFGEKERKCVDNGLGGGVWTDYGECKGAVYPQTEVCDGLDNDCDGKVDEDGVCGDCTVGNIEHAKCGPATDLGICEFGEKERNCVDNGLGGGVWTDYGECKGAVYPEEEVCFDGLDNDCDGYVDEGCHVNQPPVISGIPDVTFDEGTCATLDLDDYVEDPDNTDAELVWTVSNVDYVDISINPDTHVAVFCQKDGFIGSDEVAFTVTDPEGLYDADDVLVTVLSTGTISIDLKYPDGGEVLRGTVDILWEAESSTGNPIAIDLQFSPDRGFTWYWLAHDTENDGVWEWDTTTVPDLATYLVKAIAKDGSLRAEDVSSAIFTINNHPADPDEKDPGDYGMYVDRIVIVDEIITADTEDLQVYVSLENSGDFDMEDVTITVMIDGIGRRSVGPFDLDEGDIVSEALYIDVPPGTLPGEYPVRITFYNGHVKRVKYRFITVI